MAQATLLHSFLLYFFRMFNYILLFLPQTDDATQENSSVLGTKRRFFFAMDAADSDAGEAAQAAL